MNIATDIKINSKPIMKRIFVLWADERPFLRTLKKMTIAAAIRQATATAVNIISSIIAILIFSLSA